MRLIERIRRRWRDWRRERRISDLATCCQFEMAAGREDLAREAWDAMKSEISARSKEQRDRMGRRLMSAMHPLERERFLSGCEEKPGP